MGWLEMKLPGRLVMLRVVAASMDSATRYARENDEL